MKFTPHPSSTLVAGVVGALLLVAGCSSTPASVESSSAAASADAASSTSTEATAEAMPQSATVAIGQDLATLDIRGVGSAASFSVLRHITEPLVSFTPDGQIESALAESWEQVDPTTVRFKLRQGVTFTNGDPMNADAVKYSIDKVLDPEFQAWNRSYVEGLIKEVKVIDDSTVDIILTSPSTRLLNELTTLDILSPAYDESGKQATHPIGTGPYIFASFTPRQQVEMTANPDYWGDQPAIQNLTFRIIPDATTRVAALQAGEVQMIDGLPFPSIDAVNSGENTAVLTGDTVRLVFLAMNVLKPPLDNPKVRQAMNYALNKEELIGTVLSGYGQVPGGPCAPLVQDCTTDQTYPFDPEKAKSLLAEAGYNGEEIELTIGAGRYPNDDLMGQAMAKQLQDVGLNIKLNTMDYSSMSSELSSADGESPFDMWMQGWSADDNVLASMLSALFIAPGCCYPMGYDNPKVTKLLQSAGSSSDPAKVSADLAAAQKILWDDAAVGYLYVPKQNIGVSKSLQGFQPRFDEYFFFWDSSLL